MTNVRFIITIAALIGSVAIAQENGKIEKLPQLSIMQSNFIEIKSSSISSSGAAVAVDGKFVLLGEGIYGHFDLVAFDDSGKVLQKTKSEDRAWQRDQGGKLKSITLTMTADNPAKVEVSFHEMRIHPESGACKQ